MPSSCSTSSGSWAATAFRSIFPAPRAPGTTACAGASSRRSATRWARATPPWKKITRTKMRLAPDERPAGMVTLHDGWLGLALAPGGVVTRQATGGSRAWEALDGLDLRELLVQPVADGALVLLGLDRE